MTQKAICLLAVLAVCTQCVLGQTDYAKREVGAMASIVGADTKGAFNNDNSRDGLYGFDVQGAYNFSRFLGLKAEFSYFQKQFVTNAEPTSRLTQFMGGIKVQDNSRGTWFRPYGQALFGVSHNSNVPLVAQPASTGKAVALITGTGPSFSVGGGLDIKLTKHLDLRVFQVDYNPVWAGGQTFHNLRLGIGLNFRF